MTALLRTVWRKFGEDNVSRLAAAIAFSAMLSLAPLFVLLIALAGGVLDVATAGHGHETIENVLLDDVRRSAGPSVADAVRGLVEASFDHPRQGVFAQIAGWTFLVLGAAGFFAAVQDALNVIWRVDRRIATPWTLVRDRAASFAMALLVALLLLMTLVANAAIAIVAARVTHVPLLGSPAALGAVTQVVTIVLAAVAFAFAFKVLPDVAIGWREAWRGAIVTAVLFVAGEYAIAFYFAVAGVASAYGASGSLLVALLWLYYSAMIFLIGAEIAKAAGLGTDRIRERARSPRARLQIRDRDDVFRDAARGNDQPS